MWLTAPRVGIITCALNLRYNLQDYSQLPWEVGGEVVIDLMANVDRVLAWRPQIHGREVM